MTESLHDMVKKSQNFTDEQWADIVKAMTGKPNSEDEANAREFAQEVLS